MSLNRALVGGAAAVLTALGTNRALISNLPLRCQQAIMDKMPDDVISQVCPPGFNDTQLWIVILVGGAIFLAITFWNEIAKFIGEKLDPNST